MKDPQVYYIAALKEALQGNLDAATDLQERAEVSRDRHGYSFSQASCDEFPFIEEALTTLLTSYDFTRCVRPDGTAYGTRGKCRKGTVAAKPADSKASAKPAGSKGARTPSSHKSSLKDLTAAHNAEASFSGAGAHEFKLVKKAEKKVLEDEAALMKENPALAREILRHATASAETRRRQAAEAEAKQAGVRQKHHGIGRARELDHITSTREMQAEFHDERARQAREAMR
jgi:hypothetical protein